MKMALVQVEAIEIVPDLLATDQGQYFIGCSVPEIEAPAQFDIPFDRKEPKSAVKHPLDLSLLPPAPDHRPMKFGLGLPDGLHLEPSGSKRRHVSFESSLQSFRFIVEEINVLGLARRVRCLVEHRAARNKTVGVAACRQGAHYLALEGS